MLHCVENRRMEFLRTTGEVIYEWGNFDRKPTSYSILKSLISVLYGIYAEKGVIDVNATLESRSVAHAPS
jgi:hypothetical protein